MFFRKKAKEGDPQCVTDLEYQRETDANAKNILDAMKRMAELPREVLVPGSTPAFMAIHGAAYDAVGRDLTVVGFTCVGDYQSADHGNAPDAKRAGYRFALSTDRTVAAAWFVSPSTEPQRCIVLQSYALDGETWITGCGFLSTGLPDPPRHHATRVPERTSVRALVELHRRGTSSAASLRAFSGVDEILEQRRRDAEIVQAFRREQGLAMAEPMLRAKLGDRFALVGEPLLASILAHPEWWTFEDSPQAVSR
jgi:hypothetical protein